MVRISESYQSSPHPSSAPPSCWPRPQAWWGGWSWRWRGSRAGCSTGRCSAGDTSRLTWVIILDFDSSPQCCHWWFPRCLVLPELLRCLASALVRPTTPACLPSDLINIMECWPGEFPIIITIKAGNYSKFFSPTKLVFVAGLATASSEAGGRLRRLGANLKPDIFWEKSLKLFLFIWNLQMSLNILSVTIIVEKKVEAAMTSIS